MLGDGVRAEGGVHRSPQRRELRAPVAAGAARGRTAGRYGPAGGERRALEVHLDGPLVKNAVFAGDCTTPGANRTLDRALRRRQWAPAETIEPPTPQIRAQMAAGARGRDRASGGKWQPAARGVVCDMGNLFTGWARERAAARGTAVALKYRRRSGGRAGLPAGIAQLARNPWTCTFAAGRRAGRVGAALHLPLVPLRAGGGLKAKPAPARWKLGSSPAPCRRACLRVLSGALKPLHAPSCGPA